MRTPAGTECPYYYEDYFRGRDIQECRLIKQNPHSEPWQPSLCEECSVPAIVRANGCPNLRLEARVGRRFGLFKRVEVDAFCIEYVCEVDEPKIGCGHCHEFRRGGAQIDLDQA
jgi:hypothetical protein